MKKKLIIGAVILALIAGVTVWVIKGEEIKEKAAKKVIGAAVETVVLRTGRRGPTAEKGGERDPRPSRCLGGRPHCVP